MDKVVKKTAVYSSEEKMEVLIDSVSSLQKKVDGLSHQMEWLSDRVLGETNLNRKREKTRRFTEDLREAIEGIYESLYASDDE